MEVGRRARMRRLRSPSSGHELITDTVCGAHEEMASIPSYADCECASGSSHVTVAQSGPCRPMCGPLSLVSCMVVLLPMRDAAMCAAGLRQDDRRRWPARALRWGSCESDPNRENGPERLPPAAHRGTPSAPCASAEPGSAGSVLVRGRPRQRCPMLCVVLCDRRGKAEPTTRTGSAAAAAQPAAVCMHAARATAHVLRAIASPSECG
jgi:hypothetical protein